MQPPQPRGSVIFSSSATRGRGRPSPSLPVAAGNKKITNNINNSPSPSFTSLRLATSQPRSFSSLPRRPGSAPSQPPAARSPSPAVDRAFLRDISAIQSWLISVKSARSSAAFKDLVSSVKSLIFTPQQAQRPAVAKEESEKINKGEAHQWQWLEKAAQQIKITAHAESDEDFDEEPVAASVPAGVIFENGQWRASEAAEDEAIDWGDEENEKQENQKTLEIEYSTEGQKSSSAAILAEEFPDAPIDAAALGDLEEVSAQARLPVVDYPLELELDGKDEKDFPSEAADVLESSDSSCPPGPAGRLLDEFSLSPALLKTFAQAAQRHNKKFANAPALPSQRALITHSLQLKFVLKQAEAMQKLAASANSRKAAASQRPSTPARPVARKPRMIF